MLPEGQARRRTGLSLSVKRLFISVWITRRGVSELSWIARRSERACSTDMPQREDKVISLRRGCENCARVLDGAARRRREATRIRTQRQNSGAERRHGLVAENKFCCRRREECDRL